MTSTRGEASSGRANLRRQIKMSDEELDTFIHERLTATMCTLNRDGTIHAVAMWYGFLEGAIAFETNSEVAEGAEPPPQREPHGEHRGR